MAQTRIQEVRQAAGLSQRQLAEKAGISIRTLQHYEIGDKDLKKAAVMTVIALAEALSCDINDIL